MRLSIPRKEYVFLFVGNLIHPSPMTGASRQLRSSVCESRRRPVLLTRLARCGYVVLVDRR